LSLISVFVLTDCIAKIAGMEFASSSIHTELQSNPTDQSKTKLFSHHWVGADVPISFY